jgi:hypothetical protein
VTRKSSWNGSVAVAIVAAFALAPATVLRAAEWPNVRTSDTLWPGSPIGGAEWPNIPADASAKAAVPASQAAGPPAASPPATTPASTPLSLPAPTPDADLAMSTSAIGGPQYPVVPAPKPASFETRFASPFRFEGGTRYWYSTGETRFGFSNGDPMYGNPTSRLDWSGMTGNSGEVFARIDHAPTHLFVKGLIGAGKINAGDMNDTDYSLVQASFSDTSSAVKGDNFRYGILDVGYAFEVPSQGIRLGAFVGYHYWRETMTAFGLKYNPDGYGNFFSGPPGSVPIGFGTPVVSYDATWNAIRIGGDAKIRLYDRWTIEGEIAIVPYARASNDDSHLLRQDFGPGGLGPAPNIRTQAINAFGGEAEVFVNYLVLPHFEIGAGFRYWGLYTGSGTVTFGPDFSRDFSLMRFSTQRYGVLLQAKASF